MSYDELPVMTAASNPFLPPLPTHRRVQHPGFALAPNHAAIWAIVSARMSQLFPSPIPDLDLQSWFGDPLAGVRRELQAWLDGPTSPQTSECPWVGLMGARNPL